MRYPLVVYTVVLFLACVCSAYMATTILNSAWQSECLKKGYLSFTPKGDIVWLEIKVKKDEQRDASTATSERPADTAKNAEKAEQPETKPAKKPVAAKASTETAR